MIGLCVLGIVLGQWQNIERARGKTDFVSRLLQATANPLSGAFNRGFDASDRFWAGVRAAPQLKAENESLRAEVASARLYTETQTALEKRIFAQRELLDLPATGKEKIYADIIGYFPQDGRLTISVGKNRSVQERMAVVTGQGLIGLVSTVSDKTSQVILITSPSIKIGALVGKGDKVTAGLIKGETPTRLVMDIMEGDALQVGDLVITSGFGEFIPRGIKIGVVTQTVVDQDFGTNRAFIAPAAKVAESLEVAVLK